MPDTFFDFLGKDADSSRKRLKQVRVEYKGGGLRNNISILLLMLHKIIYLLKHMNSFLSTNLTLCIECKKYDNKTQLKDSQDKLSKKINKKVMGMIEKAESE